MCINRAADDRKLLDFEFQELKKEIERTSKETGFNTMPLLDGSRASLKIQAGANAGQAIDFTIGDTGIDALGLTSTSIATRASADAAIGELDDAIQSVSSERSRMGAYTNRLEHAYNNAVNIAENLTASESRIKDVDIPKEMMVLTKAKILLQAGQYILAMHMQQAQSVLQLMRSN